MIIVNVCMWSHGMCSSKWLYVIMIGYIDDLCVYTWSWNVIFLVDFMNFMMNYIDYSVGVCRMTCSMLTWPYMLLEWYCTCDKIIMKCVLFFRPISFSWKMKNVNMTLDLLGERTFVMNVYVWLNMIFNIVKKDI